MLLNSHFIPLSVVIIYHPKRLKSCDSTNKGYVAGRKQGISIINAKEIAV